jgi:2-oxoglutarate dehydrogenase complex dihydrolipoamide succinyltransferase (E2) component
MPITVTMPQMGESVVEGVVARWLKREGEAIARDEPLLEIMTDKVNAELPSTVDGTLLRILAPEGATVPVGAPLAEIAEAGEAPAVERAGESARAPVGAVAGQEMPAPPATEADDEGAAGMAGGRDGAAASAEGATRRYSPLVRRLAEEHRIPLDQISGSGLGGRVTKQDVLAYLGTRDAQPVEATAAPARAIEEAVARPAQPASTVPTLGPDEEFVPLTPMRRAIAEHMVRSVATAPHATTVHEVDMTRLVRWREAHRAAFRERHGVDIGPLAFVVEAVAGALKEYPMMNSSWGGDGIILKRQINIGVAVALEDGLIVPVIQRADEKSRVGLARAIADLTARARAGRLTSADVQGGAFTVNNVGVFGSIISTPIIPQPQAAILSTHAIIRRPVVVAGDAIAIRSMMYLALSFDHRIVDGMTACRFVQRVCERLEGMALDAD